MNQEDIFLLLLAKQTLLQQTKTELIIRLKLHVNTCQSNFLLLFPHVEILEQLSIPITVSHVVKCPRRPVDRARNSGIASSSARKVLEIWSGFVFVALEAIVQGSVRFVERLAPVSNARINAGFATFLETIYFSITF